MSLVLAARCQRGIVLASDPFVFDNDGEIPLKKVAFDRFYVSDRLGLALTSVGSRWVFHQFCQEMEAAPAFAPSMLNDWAARWQALSQSWKEKREAEAAQPDGKTLRPVSDSLLFLACQQDLETLYLADAEWAVHVSHTFAFSGSASHLVRSYLVASGRAFQPTDALSACLSLLCACYQAGSAPTCTPWAIRRWSS